MRWLSLRSFILRSQTFLSNFGYIFVIMSSNKAGMLNVAYTLKKVEKILNSDPRLLETIFTKYILQRIKN